MRCLFLADELGAFRPVAAAMGERRFELIVLLELEAAARIVNSLEFNALIVGANSIDSLALRFLREGSLPDLPVLGVTCAPWICPELLAAGADRVVLLPDQTADLDGALRELAKVPGR